jgi:hypothetical protein
MKKLTLIAITTLTIYGCAKDDSINPIVSDNNQSNTSIFEPSNLRGVTGNREFHAIVAGGDVTDAWCSPPSGSCLDDVVITSIDATIYNNLQQAIDANEQDLFFNNNNYTDIYPVLFDKQIQDALEKGHLKIKIVESDNIDFNLFIKPQHEKFDLPKLASKTIMTIPVNKNI